MPDDELPTNPPSENSPTNPKEQDESDLSMANPEESSSQNDDIGPNESEQNNGAREQTRSKMAIIFVLGFFAIIFLCFAFVIYVDASVNDLKELLTSTIGSLSGTLGFIV